jgi:uncharacterized membrane protein
MARTESWHPQTDPARLIALSDGIFSVGMTLAAVQVLPPDLSHRLYREGTAAVLADLWPQFVAVSVTFLLVGIYWVTHHRIFSYIRRVDRGFLMLNLLFLLGITLMPFAVQLSSLPRADTTAVAFYGGYCGTLGALLAAIWFVATRGRRLVDADLPEEVVRYGHYRSAFSATIFFLSIPVALYVGTNAARNLWLLVLFNGSIAARLARRGAKTTADLL